MSTSLSTLTHVEGRPWLCFGMSGDQALHVSAEDADLSFEACLATPCVVSSGILMFKLKNAESSESRMSDFFMNG